MTRTIEEILEKEGVYVSNTKGISMLPTLKEGRDAVVILPCTERLKKYDVALFQRANGQYILHRVVRCGETYTFVGDNQVHLEKNVQQEQIIAICTAFSRDGKRISAQAFGLRLYAVLWDLLRPFRRVASAVFRRARNILRK